MKTCLFIFVLSLVSLVHGRGVRLGIARAPIPLSGFQNGNSFTWESCASDGSMAELNNLHVSLDGYVAAVEVDVYLGEEVSGGTVNVTFSYYGVRLVQDSYSLCYIVKQAGQSCPISKGEYKETAEIDIPYIPRGNYAGSIYVTDQNGKPLGCISFDLIITDSE